MNNTISQFNKTVRELITDLREVYPNLNNKLDKNNFYNFDNSCNSN